MVTPGLGRQVGTPSSRMAIALITGATGFLGCEIVRRLLARDGETHLIALIRAGDDLTLERRRRQLVRGLPGARGKRVRVVRGDVTEARLGLSPADYAALTKRVDRVVHVAATTHLGRPLAEARRRNVGGTTQALQLCRRIREHGKEGRLDYVSTAYVAGDRADVVFESELDVGQGFRNTYERSKFEAERLCRAAMRELPIAIYRPSIIVGHSVSGETSRYNTLYWPMQVLIPFYLRWRAVTGLVPLPLGRECPLDIVPVDYVAESVATLYSRPEAAGRCYHLAAGVDGAVTIEQLVNLVCEHFHGPRRRYVDPRGHVRWLGRALRPLLRRLSPGFVRRGEHYLPYAFQNPRFDVSNARAAGLAPPLFAAYFPRLLAYAHAADFGRGRPPVPGQRLPSPERPGPPVAAEWIEHS